MKYNNIKSRFLILVATTTMILTGCKKDLQPSKVTFWPVIELKGTPTVVITVGDTYTDAGAVVTVNGTPIDFETVSTVDNTTEGVYSVSYSAVNEDGISASQERVVVVVPADAIDVPAVVGNFVLTTPSRPSPIPTMKVSSLGNHVYYSTNIYGSNGNNVLLIFPAYMYTTDGTTFNILSGPFVSGGNYSDGGAATWNPVTNKLAAAFLLPVAPGTTFSRTWTKN